MDRSGSSVAGHLLTRQPVACCEPAPRLRGEIHVWRAKLDSAPASSTDHLLATERARGARILRPEARRRRLASRWALRAVLGRYLETEPAEVELRLGPRGKPALAGEGASLRFNLSHSGGLALIALAWEREVGIDVERIDRRRERRRPAEFYTEWTRREAVAKCLGVGLGAPLPEAPVAVSEIEAGAGFAAALAVAAGELPAVRRLELDLSSGRRACGGPRSPLAVA